MCILDPNRSWDLFCNKLSPKELRAPKFVEIAKHVVNECEGLPRLIVAIAECLSKCGYILKEWKKIEKEVETLGPLYNDAEHLSFKINVKRLIRIWIAEGFVRQMECKGFGRQLVKDLEEEGCCYLDGLVHSGLVSISKWKHKMTNEYRSIANIIVGYPTHFTEEVYRKFPNLKYLKVFYKGAFEPSSSPGSYKNPTVNLDYIRCFSMLETLTVIVPANNNIGSLQCCQQFEDKMFGRDGSFARIKVDLLHQVGAQNRIVVPIFGAPGVGKTTLCQKLYADEKVVSCFDIQAWVTIPRQRYNAQQLLCHLLQSISPTSNEIHMGNTVSQLKEQLHKHLKCKRYFIVLEDVPNTLVWDDIQPCFPDDSNASRILLTTLSGDVAKNISTPAFHISFRNFSESWDLFFYRYSRNQYVYMAPKFKEIAKSLVEECKGLPRAIVTVADRLSKCNYTVKE
ncbi:PREDICTED: uncharacterized protein LOC109151972 [Ipomoea nil]|uniref:uncharacterized protein LOC109151972 n=1 Tax=Ipomoea nil TaxID=35883 RepID=UPI000901E0A3|nr:PREDICTED: uncharacterized protein LOC109151972 [Ipomoea nil]